MVADSGVKLSRARIQLPATATVWGLVVESGAYTKLVVRGLHEPYLSKAREFAGNEEGLFVGKLVPALSTCLLQHGTLKGRRHLSRLPLQDIYQFGDKLSGLLVQNDAGDRFSVTQLEDVFGECPARDGLSAFQHRSMVFYRLNVVTRSDSSISALPSPQQQHLPAPAGSGGHQRPRTTLQELVQQTMSSIDASDPAAARRVLLQIEAALDARCGTVTRTRADPTSGEKKLIGGYTYLPKFLLDAVLMCDTLTEPSMLPSAMLHSCRMLMRPIMYQHFKQELMQSRLPQAPCLYDARITFDMCSMLWAREHLLSLKADREKPWVLHLRCDSSPQFGRDYLVLQADYVQYGIDAATTVIQKRLLPIQCVGSRAGSEAHKLDKLLHSLTLESEQVSFTAERVASLLTDFGVESAAWFLPSIVDREETSTGAGFEDATVMHIMESYFDWQQFFDQLNALSRWFSIRARCDRFVSVCVRQNPCVQGIRLKQSFEELFKSTCPTMVSTRWGYLHEVLSWMLPRREALSHLCRDLEGTSATKTNSSNSNSNNSGHDFTPKEIAVIGSLCKQDFSDEVAVKFWAVAFLVWQLADWGAGVSAFFHSCPLHGYKAGEPSCKNCCWKGRMSVVLAQGTWLPTFSGQLVHAPPGAAQGFLDKLDPDVSETLIQDFRTCKVAMVQRFQQVYGYWREIPWRLCAVGMPLFGSTPDRVAASKAFALDVIEQWNQGKLRDRHHFQMAQKFLELIRHVYGFSIDSMHGDVSGIATQIQKAKEALLKMSGDRAARAVGVNGDLDAAAPETERAMRWEHIKARLKLTADKVVPLNIHTLIESKSIFSLAEYSEVTQRHSWDDAAIDRSEIQKIGMVAVSQNCMVPRHIVEGGKLEAELSLMREHGLTSLQDGKLYLTSFALATTLVLSRPVTVDVDARETALELREALLERGWATSDVAGSCAVRDKKMMRVQHAEYYSLLLNYERLACENRQKRKLRDGDRCYPQRNSVASPEDQEVLSVSSDSPEKRQKREVEPEPCSHGVDLLADPDHGDPPPAESSRLTFRRECAQAVARDMSTKMAFSFPLRAAGSDSVAPELILELSSESDDNAQLRDRADSDPTIQGAVSRPSKRLKLSEAVSDDCASPEANKCSSSDDDALEFESDDSDACSAAGFAECDVDLPASPPAGLEPQPSGEFGLQPGGDYAAGPEPASLDPLDSDSNESDSQGRTSGSESDASSWGHRAHVIVPVPSFPDESHTATDGGHGTGTFAPGPAGGESNFTDVFDDLPLVGLTNPQVRGAKPKEQKVHKEKKERKEPNKTAVFLAGGDKPLASAFAWPFHLMKLLLSKHPPEKRLHLQLHSEFSGAGTAEIAAAAICNASQGMLTVDVVSVGDWDATARTALLSNTSSATHVFSDIAQVCDAGLVAECQKRVAVKVLMTSSDVTRACGSFAFMSGTAPAENTHVVGVPGDLEVLQDGDGDYRSDAVPVDIESLFKRESRKEETFHILKMGVGNALKDYQLLSVVGDTEQNPEGRLLNAKTALQAPKMHTF
ncbi:RSN1 [Symbiodinium microadriaticum]|nr:RSN1 [Symbiodinium sp. KB8]CAE7194085.1 RSN1 [Symbiodinium microadriaticum]